MSGGDGPSGAWEGCARAFCGGGSCPHPFFEFAALGREMGEGGGHPPGLREAHRKSLSFWTGLGWGRALPVRGRTRFPAGGERASLRPLCGSSLSAREGFGWTASLHLRTKSTRPAGHKKSPVPGGNGGFLLDLCRAQNSSPQRRKPPQASRPTKMVMTTR